MINAVDVSTEQLEREIEKLQRRKAILNRDREKQDADYMAGLVAEAKQGELDAKQRKLDRIASEWPKALPVLEERFRQVEELKAMDADIKQAEADLRDKKEGILKRRLKAEHPEAYAVAQQGEAVERMKQERYDHHFRISREVPLAKLWQAENADKLTRVSAMIQKQIEAVEALHATEGLLNVDPLTDGVGGGALYTAIDHLKAAQRVIEQAMK